MRSKAHLSSRKSQQNAAEHMGGEGKRPGKRRNDRVAATSPAAEKKKEGERDEGGSGKSYQGKKKGLD